MDRISGLGYIQAYSSDIVKEDNLQLSKEPTEAKDVATKDYVDAVDAKVAVLDPDKVNAGITVFVSVRTDEHSAAWMKGFAEAVDDMPEVVGFFRMSGDVDYLLHVVVPDIAAYDGFYKRLIARVPLKDVSSAFAMERIKQTTALPLHHLPA